MQKEANKKIFKKLYELVGVLSVQFILGVALTTVINYDPSKASLIQKIILGLHIFIGAYLLIISTLFVIKSIRLKLLVTESWLGLIAVITAFGSGSVAARNGNDWATLIMAVSFLVAFLAYLLAVMKLSSRKA